MLAASCANSQKEEAEDGVLRTEHFDIYYTELDSDNIQVVADSLENNYARIVSSLQAGKMEKVNLNYYSSKQDLKNAVKDVEPNLPDFAIGLATSVSQIHLLSPNYPNLDFQYMVRNTIHEFAHCVSYRVNPNIPNNPRWLWEAVAQYESGQFVNPKSLKYVVDNTPPSLEELSQFTNAYIYEVGYFIAEYLVQTHGEAILNELILNHGNIEKSIGMNADQLTEAWVAYVREKHAITKLVAP
jgi:hypothetical protein